MADNAHRCVFAVHPVSVILDEDSLATTVFELDADRRGACVDGVVEEFLDHGSRPLDHFASGDLVDERIAEEPNALRHRTRVSEPRRRRNAVDAQDPDFVEKTRYPSHAID